MLCGAGRVSIAYASAARPAPASTREHAVAAARASAHARAMRGSSRSTRFGSQRRPSRNSTVVTTSTDELRQREVGRREPDERQADDQADDAEHVSAASRWNLACHAAPTRAAPADQPEQRRTPA